MRAPVAWTTAALLLLLCIAAEASDGRFTDAGPDLPAGEALFVEHCRSCHSGIIGSRAPSPNVLGRFPPRSIVHALTAGVMRVQGYSLSGDERRLIAEYLTGEQLTSTLGDYSQGQCTSPSDLASRAELPDWNGWGGDPKNTSFRTAEQTGLREDDIARLQLAWAFGFADSYSAWAQPVVVNGSVFVGSQAGVFYSIDAKTGCTHWTYKAPAGIRGAASVFSPGGGTERDAGLPDYIVLFGDLSGTVHALDASTGRPIWATEVESHPKARVTGSPTYFDGRLYVPMSSWVTVNDPSGACCTFRGSLSAIDARTGEVVWKTYTIPNPAEPLDELGKQGEPLLGPSGSAIWSAPAVDFTRAAVYAATGNSYTGPATNSDSIIAFSLDDGHILWTRQATPDDVWLDGCQRGSTTCVRSEGPNFDFGAAPVLATTASGRELLIVGQKSGMVYALDPDRRGEIVWQYRAGHGGPGGGVVWGSGADHENAYFPVSDITRMQPGGLHAIDLQSGERTWYAAPAERLCGVRRYGCSAAQPVAIAITPVAVFAGAADGGFRAYSVRSGEILWEYDTNRDFNTVNGVEAAGGSLIGAGPTVAGGMVYVNSGYGTNGGRAGNVLLAFAPAGE